MLIDTIKEHVDLARKTSDKTVLSILTVILGEAQTLQFRKGHAPTVSDEEVIKIIKKLIESNTETIRLSPVSSRNIDSKVPFFDVLEKEIEILSAYLPKVASKEEIKNALAATVLSGLNEGQAIGKAIKHLKSEGIVAESKDVIEVVKELLS
ncbi:MAG: GatB/YqeY domain-containing protein [Proteobacteria bacterium]|jgi:uncharacterized protein YqeY|nr:GatB/YqeY domain-containing protein [Pseudomonadota bacterium]